MHLTMLNRMNVTEWMVKQHKHKLIDMRKSEYMCSLHVWELFNKSFSMLAIVCTLSAHLQKTFDTANGMATNHVVFVYGIHIHVYRLRMGEEKKSDQFTYPHDMEMLGERESAGERWWWNEKESEPHCRSLQLFRSLHCLVLFLSYINGTSFS